MCRGGVERSPQGLLEALGSASNLKLDDDGALSQAVLGGEDLRRTSPATGSRDIGAHGAQCAAARGFLRSRRSASGSAPNAPSTRSTSAAAARLAC